jgi:hypothetical protein
MHLSNQTSRKQRKVKTERVMRTMVNLQISRSQKAALVPQVVARIRKIRRKGTSDIVFEVE